MVKGGKKTLERICSKVEKGTRGTRSPDLIFGVQMLPKRFKGATAAKAEMGKNGSFEGANFGS